MINAIYNFFRHETDRFTIGGVYLPNLSFSLTVEPFNWLQFHYGHPWMYDRHGHLGDANPQGIWLIIGPLDIGVSW